MFFAVFYAVILTNEKIKCSNFFRVVFYIPNILSTVVVSGIFSAVYNQGNGLIDAYYQFLIWCGPSKGWLGDQNIVIYSIAFALDMASYWILYGNVYGCNF